MFPLIVLSSLALLFPVPAPVSRPLGESPDIAATEASGPAEMKQGGDGAATVWRADDGLFYVNATINGTPVRLVVDTGASLTVLSPDDARRAGVDRDDNAIGEVAQTAGGVRRMMRVKLAQMQVAGIAARGVTAVVASQSLPFSLLGQNWLSRIGSVTIEGDRMILR